jgi:hypothetical protein
LPAYIAQAEGVREELAELMRERGGRREEE